MARSAMRMATGLVAKPPLDLAPASQVPRHRRCGLPGPRAADDRSVCVNLEVWKVRLISWTDDLCTERRRAWSPSVDFKHVPPLTVMRGLDLGILVV